MFDGKHILVGVTGGIAAYKTAFLVRELMKRGASVKVMMTEAGTRFVTPLTFETLTEHPVATHMFGDSETSATVHIEWARWPDMIVICPATANTIAKVAHGLADNLLTTTILASTVPVLFCPAMNVEMYQNSLYQQNERILETAGYSIVQPGSGFLACRETGAGRLADTEDIIDKVHHILYGSKELDGKKVVVTAGPTREPLDPVRYLSNRSSGKMGFAIAEEASLRGANVVLIAGPVHLKASARIRTISVETALQMANAVSEQLVDADVLVMAAAVSDFVPAQVSQKKIKKSGGYRTLELAAAPDILKSVGSHKNGRLHIGFSLETNNEMVYARQKLQEKQCDLLVVNNPLEPGAGFDVDTNKVLFLFKNGDTQPLPLMSKRDVAKELLNNVQTLLQAV